MLPKDWKRSSIGNLARIDDRTLPANTPASFCFRYISLSDVLGRQISPNLMTYAFSDAPSRARRLLKLNDILFSTVRPNLHGHALVTHDYLVGPAKFNDVFIPAQAGIHEPLVSAAWIPRLRAE